MDRRPGYLMSWIPFSALPRLIEVGRLPQILLKWLTIPIKFVVQVDVVEIRPGLLLVSPRGNLVSNIGATRMWRTNNHNLLTSERMSMTKSQNNRHLKWNEKDPKLYEGKIENENWKTSEKPIPQDCKDEWESRRAGTVVISVCLAAELNFAYNYE